MRHVIGNAHGIWDCSPSLGACSKSASVLSDHPGNHFDLKLLQNLFGHEAMDVTSQSSVCAHRRASSFLSSIGHDLQSQSVLSPVPRHPAQRQGAYFMHSTATDGLISRPCAERKCGSRTSFQFQGGPPPPGAPPMGGPPPQGAVQDAGFQGPTAPAPPGAPGTVPHQGPQGSPPQPGYGAPAYGPNPAGVPQQPGGGPQTGPVPKGMPGTPGQPTQPGTETTVDEDDDGRETDDSKGDGKGGGKGGNNAALLIGILSPLVFMVGGGIVYQTFIKDKPPQTNLGGDSASEVVDSDMKS